MRWTRRGPETTIWLVTLCHFWSGHVQYWLCRNENSDSGQISSAGQFTQWSQWNLTISTNLIAFISYNSDHIIIVLFLLIINNTRIISERRLIDIHVRFISFVTATTMNRDSLSPARHLHIKTVNVFYGNLCQKATHLLIRRSLNQKVHSTRWVNQQFIE